MRMADEAGTAMNSAQAPSRSTPRNSSERQASMPAHTHVAAHPAHWPQAMRGSTTIRLPCWKPVHACRVNDRSGEFVSKDERPIERYLPRRDIQVGSAQPYRMDGNQHFIR